MSNLFEDLYIFEMANSHQGSVDHGIDIIKEMAKIARKENIKAAVKLQFRNLDNFIHPASRGREDVPHVSRFESTRLTFDEFSELVDVIHDEGLIAISTPFDEDSVDWCMDMGIDILKVASCSSLDWPLLTKISSMHKPVIISTGGKTISDMDKIYNFFSHRKCDFAMMHCVAEYPTPEDRLQLDIIDKMKKRYPDITIGYSGHENPDDSFVPVIAVAKGAKILERHVGLPTETITLNSYSMNPEQADKWVQFAETAKCMCIMKNGKKHISQAELDSLNSLARGVYLKHDVEAGTVLTEDDVYFAMPCHDKQTCSGEFEEGIKVKCDYKADDELHDKRKSTDIALVRSVIHDAKGMLYEAGIALGDNFEVELSHHYGMKHFRQTGAILVTVINREYCKKLLIILPGQVHPVHMHKVKEETLQLLYGDLTMTLDGVEKSMKAGDVSTILRGTKHGFSSVNGAIFEEISTTATRSDSYYEDPKISTLDPIERKTFLKEW